MQAPFGTCTKKQENVIMHIYTTKKRRKRKLPNFYEKVTYFLRASCWIMHKSINIHYNIRKFSSLFLR